MIKDIKSKALTVIILLLAILLVGYFFVMPQWQKYSLNRDVLKQVRLEQEDLKQAQASLASFLDEYDNLISKKVLTDQTLPVGSVSFPSIMASLEKMAQDSFLALGGMQVKAKGSTAPRVLENALDYSDVELSLVGSYPSFRNFLLLLESHMRIIDVQSVSFQVDESDSVQFQVVLRTYYQK